MDQEDHANLPEVSSMVSVIEDTLAVCLTLILPVRGLSDGFSHGRTAGEITRSSRSIT